MGQGATSPIGNTGVMGPAPTVQMAQPSTEAAIAPYYVGGGTTGQQYQQMLQKEYQGIEGNTTNRFTDMFNKYLDVANTQANLQASKIGESLGSRGALYSSANLQQQADLRQKTSQDIASTASQYQTTLEGQRQSALQNVFTGQAGLASAEMGAREAAMGRAYQDFIRQSGVPPWAQTGAQIGATRPGGATVAM